MKTVVSKDLPKLYDLAAAHVSRRICEAVEARGRCSLLLSGGATPVPLYERLARAPLAVRIPWESVWVGWADERCVPPDDGASNYGAARNALLRHVPIPERQILRIQGELEPDEASTGYERALKQTLGEDGHPDLVLLGMGADGHTASLFPEHPALDADDQWAMPVHVPAEPPQRITLTLPILNRARNVAFLVLGKHKAVAFRRLRDGDDLPAARVNPASGDVVWFLDLSAARG